jgi:hypothetical protein
MTFGTPVPGNKTCKSKVRYLVNSERREGLRHFCTLHKDGGSNFRLRYTVSNSLFSAHNILRCDWIWESVTNCVCVAHNVAKDVTLLSLTDEFVAEWLLCFQWWIRFLAATNLKMMESGNSCDAVAESRGLVSTGNEIDRSDVQYSKYASVTWIVWEGSWIAVQLTL